jgi:hypothetical protein
VVNAAKEAGGKDCGACVVYALLVNKRWFKKQAMLELWDADLHNIRAIACEVIAKHLYGFPIFLESRKRTNGVTGSRPRMTRNISYRMCS